MRGRQIRKTSGGLSSLRAASLLVLAILLATLPAVVAGQGAAPAAPVHKATHAHRRAQKKSVQQPAAPVEATPAQPPQPEIPKWPVNEKANPAIITWDSQGLRIQAANSSLEQILRDVSTATGAKVEGFSSDQRVFGVYGPGKARDVLSEVLLGAGYNVLMVGDLGLGAPRRILLTSRGAQPGQAAQTDQDAGNPENGDDEGEVVEEPQIPVPQPAFRPGFNPGGPPRTPQQIMQEMQQRQQRIQDLQQQQQQPQ